MNSTAIILLSFLLAAAPVFSQDEKGASPVRPPGSAGRDPQTTRAVVVGISDYQDEKIPDLRFADRDAEAFAAFLKTPAGGSLDGDHLKLLTNSGATTAQFDAALGWLLDETKPGDGAIIYFSGHGDVETKTRSQQGFLLCWDSPPQSYVSGAYPVFFLKEVVSTLSVQNRGQVVLITDACRAGKLAGNNIGGAQLTSQNLAQQFSNEAKILSCQPDEFSIEGEQWGGGRGAFSFHLVEGLSGLADANGDQSVSLFEIGRYLEDHVAAEVAPQRQMPMTVGNRAEKMATVFPELVAQVKKERAARAAAFSPTDNRGIEEDVLATVDSATRSIYFLFKKALKEKDFLENPDSGQPAGQCADAYYARLTDEPKLERLHNSMRRNYAAALQDEAQQAVNNLLKTERTETRLYRTERLKKYAPYPALLARAAKLVGPAHYMYPTLRARKAYFEGAILQMESPLNPDPVLGRRILGKFNAAFSWQPDAALTYLSMSDVFSRILPDADSMLFYGQKAIEAAPNWVGVHIQVAQNAHRLGITDRAAPFLKNALALDSTSAEAWAAYGTWLKWRDEPDAAELLLARAVGLDPGFAEPFLQLGVIQFDRGNMAEAIRFFKKAEETGRPDDNAYNYLGSAHFNIGQLGPAEAYFKKGLEIEPNSVACLLHLANIQLQTGRPGDAECLIEKALAYDSTARAQFLVAETYTENGQYAKAEAVLQKCLAQHPRYAAGWYGLGFVFLKSGHFGEAVGAFGKATEIEPRAAALRLMLANAQVMAAQFAAARQTLDGLLRTDPKNAEVHANLAILAAAEGNAPAALAAAERAFRLGMGHGQIYSYPNFDFSGVRKLPGFAALERKYFPEKAAR